MMAAFFRVSIQQIYQVIDLCVTDIHIVIPPDFSAVAAVFLFVLCIIVTVYRLPLSDSARSTRSPVPWKS